MRYGAWFGANITWRGGRAAEGAGLENRPGSDPNDGKSHDLDPSPETVLARCLALFERERPELAQIVRTWDTLPEPVRAGMVAMVQSTEGR